MRIHLRLSASFICIAFGLLSLIAPPAEANADDFLAKLRQRQEKVRDVRADFQQERTSELLRKPIKSFGKFYYKKPDLIRWQYQGDANMTVIYDGKSLWVHYPDLAEAEEFADVSRFSSMLHFSLDALSSRFDIRGEDKGDVLLVTLTPKGQAPFSLVRMEFPLDSAFPGRTVLTDRTGNSTTISFSRVTMNTSLPDSLFHFTPPSGTKIRERSLR